MANPYYTHGSYPSTGAAGSSASMRAELDAVSAGFDKMPTLAGAAGRLVIVNAGATGLDSTTVISISGTTVTFGGAVTGVTDLTTTGNTALGNAVTDTLSVSGLTVKGAAGNWTFAAPSSGTTLDLTGLTGQSPLIARAANGTLELGARIGVFGVANNPRIDLAFTEATAIARIDATGAATPTLQIAIGGTTAITIGSSRNVTVAAPVSGVTLVVGEAAAVTDTARLGGVRFGLDAGLSGGTVDNIYSSARPLAIGTSGAFATSLWSNGVSRITLGSAGNVTIAAPSSGTTLVVNGLAGATIADFASGAASDGFIKVTATGVRAWSLAALTSGGAFAIRNSSGVDNFTVSVAGNISIAAPTGGNTLFLNNIAGQYAWNTSDGTTTSYWYTSAGVQFGTLSNHPIQLNTNNTARVVVAAAGNITISAPASGVGLTQTGFAGSDTAIFNGGTSGSFRVTDRGLPYGTSIHNNAGAVTGTTNQYIASGTWTPTLTGVLNIGTSGANVGQWARVGNVVTCSVQIAIAPTATTTQTSLRLSLPIASNLANTFDAIGCGGGQATTSLAVQMGTIFGASATDDALYAFFSNSTTNAQHAITFTYLIS